MAPRARPLDTFKPINRCLKKLGHRLQSIFTYGKDTSIIANSACAMAAWFSTLLAAKFRKATAAVPLSKGSLPFPPLNLSLSLSLSHHFPVSLPLYFLSPCLSVSLSVFLSSLSLSLSLPLSLSLYLSLCPLSHCLSGSLSL